MKRFCVFLVAVAIAGLSASPLWAQSGSGTWSTNAAGSWSVVTNWSGSSTYPSGPDNIANFSVLTGNTAVSDDLTTNTIGYLVFGSGAATLSPAVAGNALTLQTTLPGTTPTITVGGSTTTMSLGLAGSQGFILNGGGNLTFATAASLPTGPVVINAGALQFSGTLSTATTFVVNNGATLTLGTDANIGGTNFPSSAIYLSSSGNPTATLNGNGFNNGTTSNQILTTLSGNGNVNCGFTTVSILAANFWQSYGGIMNWGTNTLGIRFNSTTTTMNAQMAEINLGTASGNLSDKSGSTATLFVGALAGGPGTSMASSVTTIEGMANLSTSWSGATAGPFTKIGIGTLNVAPASAWTTASVAANGGTMQLNYTNAPNGVLASSTTTTFTGGTLYLLGNASGVSLQTMRGIVVNSGDGQIAVNANGGSGTTLNLGTITDTAVGGGLNFNAMSGSVAITTTSAQGADGAYSGRLTYTDSTGNTDFVTAVTSVGSTSTLGRYTAYSPFTGSGDSLSTDYALVGNGALGLSDTVNLLKISTNGAGQSLSGNFTLTLSGALLFTGSNNYSINTTGLNSMFFTSGGSANADILIHNYGTGSLTIAAKMNNNNGGATLTLDGTGTTILTNTASSYNGATYVNGATLSTSSALVLGGTNNTSALELFGGTFQATQSFSLNNSTANHNVIIGGGGGTFDVTPGNTLTVGGTVSNVNVSNIGPLVKVDSGTLVLPTANTYSGATIIDGGVLSVGVLANGLALSSIGTSSAAAPALVLNGGVLQYTGTGASSDRSFVLTNNGGGIDASGSGPLVFSTTSSVMLIPSPIVTTGPLAGSGPRLFTLTGTNSGLNIFAGQILDGTGGATSLNKSGLGQWVLSNVNTYSGGTTVAAGTLSLASPFSTNNIASSTPINVAAAGVLNVNGLANAALALTSVQTLTGAGTVTGSLTAPALSTINPGTVTSGNAGIGTLAISSGLSLLGNSTVNFGLNGSNGTANLVSVGAALALPASGAPVNVNLYIPNTSSQFLPASGTTTYDLFQYGSLTGSLSELNVANGVGAYQYSFGTVAIGGADYVQLSATLVNVVATWSNTGAGNWSNPSNWSGGVPQVAGDSAIFSSAITSSATVTLDQAETVGSVTFSNTNGYTISGTNTLTLSSASGASLSDNLGSHTIAVPLNLAVNTGASVANGSVLTISGRLGGGGALTKNGNGTLVLANSNGYGPAAGSVGTTLNAGILRVGNNAALSTGDVSVAGNGTLQAGANGLVLNNNLVIAPGNTATVDTQGNTLTLAGLVSESAPSGSLAVIGAGTLVLANSNTYTGQTTITSATLQLDNGGSAGYVGGPILNNGALALDRGDTGLVLSSVISGTGSLAQNGLGMSTLNAANTFGGNTTISGGTLQLANSLALQNSTLVLNNPNGTLSFGTLTAATLGGLSGSQALTLLNTSAAPIALTVGNNGLPTTYSGGLSDAGAGASLTTEDVGTFTLTGSSSLGGATNVNAGALVIGAGGVLNTAAVNAASVATLSVAGGTVNSSAASSIGTRNVGGGVFSMSSGAANFNAGVALQNADGGLISITGGSLSALSITLPRTSQPGAPSAVGVPPTIPTNTGLYISGGTATIGTLTIANGNSSATARIDGGAVTATGEVLIGNLTTGGRWSYLQVNGGSFTSTDTVNGIVIGQVNSGIAIDSELYLSGGTTSAQIINFGTAADTAGGTANLALRGGTLYLGSGGLVQPNTSGLGSNIFLGSGVLGATSTWSTAMNISLVGNATTGTTIQAADSFGNPQNITLGGVVSGAGAVTKTGGGLLTLSNDNVYTGNTTVSAGTLALSSPSFSSNNIPSSPLITVAGGAVLDATGLGNATLALAAEQTFTGPGTVNGSLTASAQSAINPGTVASGLAGSGTLNIAGGLTLLGGASVNFGLSGSNSTANVVNVGGTLTLPVSTPAVNINLYVPNTSTAFVPANGAVYDLFQYGSLSGSLSELSVANASGLFTYSFGTVAVGAADYVQLSITQGSIWTTNGSGNWSSSGNWSAAVPQNPGDTAIFSSAITSSATVTLDQPESAGSVAFSNTNSYTISGTNTLTLSSTSGGGQLSVALGSHTIAVPLNLVVNTVVSVANSGMLTISSQISGPGTLTTSNGNGTLVLSNSNGYGPAAGSVGTTLNAGTVRVGTSASLSTGDVSVGGNSTIQAGANGLVLPNNFLIAGGATVTFDTQGNMLTLPGQISESSPSGSLTVIGTGTVLLTGANTFTGTTTIGSATLQLDNGGSNGYVGGPIVNNGALVIDRGDTGLTLSSVISGSGSLAQIGSGVSTLNAANTFSGNTTISAGTLQLDNSLALQNSTLIYNNEAGALVFGGLNAATLGGLSGSQSLPLLNNVGGAVALTVGSNSLSTTYSGAFSDAGAGGSLTKVGSGTMTLTGSSSYTGTTSVTGGNLILPAGSSINGGGAVSISGNAILSVAGGTLTAPSGSISTNPGEFSISSGVANFSGALNANQNSDNFWLISATGGSLSANSMTLGRGGITTQVNGPLVQATPVYALYVNGASVNVAGTIFEGLSSSYNSSVSIRIDSGLLSVGGAVQVSDITLGRWSVLDVNGGTLSVADTTNGVELGTQTSADSSLVVDGSAATAIVGAITLGVGASSGSGVVSLTAGALYVGAGGIVQAGGGSFGSSILLGGGTLGATAPWSSSLPMSLTGNATTGVTVQAGDPFGNPQNITLSGNLSGNGALTLGGGGTGQLILSGSNTYTGDTVVDSGTLVVETPDSLPTGANLLVGQEASTIFGSVEAASLAAPSAVAAAVPEPPALALLLAALWTAAACRRFLKRPAPRKATVLSTTDP